MNITSSRFQFYFASNIVLGLAAIVFTYNIPSDPKNAIWLGMSSSRLAILFVLLIATALFAALAWQDASKANLKQNLVRWANDRTPTISKIMLSAIPLLWVALMMPSERLLTFANYHIRLYPTVAWGFASSCLLIVILHPEIFNQANLKNFRQALSPIYKPAAITAILMSVLIYIIYKTQIGLKPDLTFWNDAATPVLPQQLQLLILITISFTATVVWAKDKLTLSQQKTSYYLATVVWIIAATVWLATPLQENFFLSYERPPNLEIYPNSDARVHDIGAQFILAGEGVNNEQATDKPLYMLFLAGLHALVGDEYRSVMTAQVILIALYPAILFLLGSEMHSWQLGLLTAGFGIVKERNALLLSNELNLSHSKLLLTEMPTTLLVALIAYLVFKWLSNPALKREPAIYIGGLVGLATLIRTNPFILIPAIIAISIIPYWKARKLKLWLLTIILFVSIILITIAPWHNYTAQATGRSYFIWKLWNVLRERFGLQLPYFFEDRKRPPPTPIPTPSYDQPESNLRPGKAMALAIIQDDPPPDPDDAAYWFAAHTLNNEISALFILPTQFLYQDFSSYTSDPIWNPKEIWRRGALTPTQQAAMILNLTMISIGIGWSAKRWGFIGLAPLLISASYYVGNGLARTSGGRYLLAGEWATYLYFGLGLMVIIKAVWDTLWPTHNQWQEQVTIHTQLNESPQTKLLPHFSIAALAFGGIGLLLASTHNVIPAKYQDRESKFDLAIAGEVLKEMEISASDITEFLDQGSGDYQYGKAIFPEFYNREVFFFEGFSIEYSHISFRLISPEGQAVIVPIDEQDIKPLTNGAEILIIGCNFQTHFQARIIIQFEDDMPTGIFTANTSPLLLGCDN